MDTEKILNPLPVGLPTFDRVIEGGYYYVDKSLFIKDLLDKGAAVTLCTRPRRFGKTLNLTMLRSFFEDTAPIGGKDTRSLFRRLKIESAGEKYMGRQGQNPVIYLSFKEGKRSSFEWSYNSLKDQIADEFSRHSYVFEKISQDSDKALFETLISGKGTCVDYAGSLKFLSKCLENYHGKRTVILIDEYDVPLENAWRLGFYDDMINFIRPVLSDALKDNPHLELAVITGCLRVSKESIFTGLNNLDMISILSDRYGEHFGFTQAEMDAILEYYGLMEKRDVIRNWYNGYLFGKTEVYNPWSSVQSIGNWSINIDRLPESHWANTSSNDIVRKLIDKATATMKDELETLMVGGTISKVIHEDITFDEIDNEPDNLWNFLFFTGYLKKVGERPDGVKKIVDMAVPNLELQYVYETKIQEWFRERLNKKNLDPFFNAILTGDAETFEDELSKLLLESISFMDCAESFYHGFMVGILNRLDGYKVTSNRESGKGRGDLVLHAISRKRGKAVIFEFKLSKKVQGLPAASEEALKQIEDMDYAAYWLDDGYTNIMKYGIAFCGKDCEVRLGKIMGTP